MHQTTVPMLSFPQRCLGRRRLFQPECAAPEPQRISHSGAVAPRLSSTAQCVWAPLAARLANNWQVASNYVMHVDVARDVVMPADDSPPAWPGWRRAPLVEGSTSGVDAILRCAAASAAASAHAISLSGLSLWATGPHLQGQQHDPLQQRCVCLGVSGYCCRGLVQSRDCRGSMVPVPDAEALQQPAGTAVGGCSGHLACCSLSAAAKRGTSWPAL